MKIFYRILFAICAVVLFRGMLACGGGGAADSDDSTLTEALTIAERISVVDAQESESASVSALVKNFRILQRAVSDLPADSDYFTDEQHIWVEEHSTQVFDTVNQILCMMNQTAYDQMINLGPYVAQIDYSQCESKDDASKAGQGEQDQSSGSTMTDYEFWTLNSYRNAGESHYVEVWVHQSGDEYEPALDIDVLVEITETASETNPLGLFTMNFDGRMAGDGHDSALLTRVGDESAMHGFLSASRDEEGRVVLQFANEGSYGEFVQTEAATLHRSTDGFTGSGSVAMSETDLFGTKEMAGDFAYNEGYFLRAKQGDSICLSRTSFDETTWNYGLYDAITGDRVERESGFSIQYNDFWGWAGYYGIWLPNDLFDELQSGDIINRTIFGSGGPPTLVPYTLFKAPGKLMKHTRHTLTLGDITGIPLSLWRCVGEGECGEYRVVFDGTLFLVNGIRDTENYVWNDLEEESLTINYETDWTLNFWTQALGGSVLINLHNKDTGANLSIDALTTVIFYSEDVVTPQDTDTPAELICFENCITNEGYVEASTWQVPFEETFSNKAMNGPLLEGQTHMTYAFDLTTMALSYQDETIDGSDLDDGLWTNALVAPDNLAQLTCSFEPYGTCPWMAWEVLDEYYTFETGPNSWNHYTTLIDDADAIVVFDAPLMLQYVHDDVTYILEYNGFPNLFGIPGNCIQMETGESISCEDAGSDSAIRWIPQFSIPDGSTATDMEELSYYIKGIDKEQRMTAVDVGECTNAGLTVTSYTLPDLSLWEAHDIGEEPDADIAVIAGEVQ